MMKSVSSKYWMTKVRTDKKYILFLALQLILSGLIVIVALVSEEKFRNELTLAGEYVLAVCITVDIVIRYYTEQQFLKTRGNILDVILLVCFVAIIVFVTFSEDDQEAEILEIDDIVLIGIILLRYVLQTVRLVLSIKNTKQTLNMQKELKELDLNRIGSSSREAKQMEISMNQSEVFKKKLMGMRMGSQEIKAEPACTVPHLPFRDEV